jgi:hypothetical protein
MMIPAFFKGDIGKDQDGNETSEKDSTGEGIQGAGKDEKNQGNGGKNSGREETRGEEIRPGEENRRQKGHTR